MLVFNFEHNLDKTSKQITVTVSNLTLICDRPVSSTTVQKLSLSSLSVCSNMPKKQRRKGDPRNDTEDFQMMDIDDFLPPSSDLIAASTSTVINISQWDIDGDQIHGKSSLASIKDPMAESAPSATDSTTQATFDYDIEVESTFHVADEDISLEHDTSTKRSFLSVSHFHLTTITAVLNHY